MRSASHSDGSKISDTGTAVITMKLCSLPTPSLPNETRMIAVAPIAMPQNARTAEEGSSVLDMATEIT